jgi:hypothetical protein
METGVMRWQKPLQSGLTVNSQVRIMLRFFSWIVLLLAAWIGQAAAHSGHGSTADVHVYAENMKVVIRTSISLAWARLGDRAPAKADEEGRKTALPWLISAAPSLIQVTAGGEPLLHSSADCMFEVDDHVAFVLVYERPQKWPVELDAGYVRTLGELDTTTISVFDRTASRFARDLRPLLEKTVSSANSRVSFTLATAPQPLKNQAPESEKDRKAVGNKPVSIADVLWVLGLTGLIGWFFLRFRGRIK